MAASQTEIFFNRCWYEKSLWFYCLLPLSALYLLVTTVRRWLFKLGFLNTYKASVPIIVVGNITTGGTGKTPVVIALVTALQKAGFNPGVISRGYGASAPYYPFFVSPKSNPEEVGDEPLLIAQRCSVPVAIDPARKNAVKHLMDNANCDVIVTDDGLQHYALQRDIEIVVVDAVREFGNRMVLPAGPLRETVKRLSTVDYIISNGGTLSHGIPERPELLPPQVMALQPLSLRNINLGNDINIADWTASKKVHAVAGIGNPQRFYQSLRHLGFDPIEHSFADHHQYANSDFQFDDELPVIMTEKDAVKIALLDPREQCWYLSVEAIIDETFYSSVIKQLQTLSTIKH